jgi:hypothetical protein
VPVGHAEAVTSCGRCGHELPSAGGRFCGRCGHEAIPGNARYPLYADGSAALTRRRPRVVADGVAGADVDADVEQTMVRADPAVTRPRLPIALFDTGAGLLQEVPSAGLHRRPGSGVAPELDGVLPSSRWGMAVLTTLAVMLVVAVLGAWLMLH